MQIVEFDDREAVVLVVLSSRGSVSFPAAFQARQDQDSYPVAFLASLSSYSPHNTDVAICSIPFALALTR
jgi:hypothetical protein